LLSHVVAVASQGQASWHFIMAPQTPAKVPLEYPLPKAAVASALQLVATHCA
jgi:hypothetical protein